MYFTRGNKLHTLFRKKIETRIRCIDVGLVSLHASINPVSDPKARIIVLDLALEPPECEDLSKCEIVTF